MPNYQSKFMMKWTVEKPSIFLLIHNNMDYNQFSYTNIMYTVYTSPIQVVDDFDTACIVADDYFNATGIIVAVEENVPTLPQLVRS